MLILRDNPLFGEPKGKKRDFEDSVIPLINIVFLLLIFFIISGTDKVFQSELPSTQHGSEKYVALDNNIFIEINEGGEVVIDEKYLSTIELANRLREIEHDSTVVIVADKNTKAVAIDPVIYTLSQAKIRSIKLLVSSSLDSRL